jgi:hypothetical protein
MVIWGSYLESIALAFDTTQTQAGVMFSIMFTIGLIVVVLIATRGKKPEITVSFVAWFVTIFFTFIGWYPIWIGSVIAIIISIVISKIISGGF